MTTQITNNIKISVLTGFEGTFVKNGTLHYAFSYQITIENNGKNTVQLLSRHWEILDSLNQTQEIDGEGVIGKQPILKAGESHSYSSGCVLFSNHGAMSGHYNMVDFITGENFKVQVPKFLLSASYALN
jgi:ApaG protein